MQAQTQLKTEDIVKYALSFEAPAEKYFFTAREVQKLEAEQKKLEATQNYAQAVLKNPEVGQNIEKDITSGKIYSSSEAKLVYDKLLAMEGTGARVDVRQSMVNPTGEVVILSQKASGLIRVIADGFAFQDEAQDFIEALKKDGLSQEELSRVQHSFDSNGAVIYQLGAFAALKSILEEAMAVNKVKNSFEAYKSSLNKPAPMPPSHGLSLDQLRTHVAPTPLPPPPKPVQKPSQPLISPEELKKEVTTKELPKPEIKPVATPLPKPVTIPPPAPKIPQIIKPAPAPVPVPPRKPAPLPHANIPMPKLNSKAKLGLESLKDITVVDELKKIEAAHLRQGYLPEQVKLLRAKVAYLASINKLLPIQVISAFEQSPLFKLYLQLGALMIAQTNTESQQDYRQMVADMAYKGEEVLTLPEFEAMADLRKDLEKM